MVYKIIISEEFEKQYNDLPKTTQEQIKKLRDKIKENPYVGDPLGYKFLEKRNFRDFGSII